MKPYSKIGLSAAEKIFNYRLSRARRVVENAFGILVWRFRIFSRPIDLAPETIDKVFWAGCCLHNWLRKTDPGKYMPQQAVDGEDLNTGNMYYNEANILAEIVATRMSKSNHVSILNVIFKKILDRYSSFLSLPRQGIFICKMGNICSSDLLSSSIVIIST